MPRSRGRKQQDLCRSPLRRLPGWLLWGALSCSGLLAVGVPQPFAPVALAAGPASSPAAGPAPEPRTTTRYLLVGGGSTPYNTHVSLEEHLARAGLLLDARAVPRPGRVLLFADGTTTNPVVEVLAAELPRDDLLRELALIMDRGDNRTVSWRPTHLSGIDGPATRARLMPLLQKPGSSSRTVLYFAGHGYAGGKDGSVTLGLWDQERLNPRELARGLDSLPDNHRVVAVLAQCYAGGFGSFIYQDGDPKRGFASRDRCGFFAAPEDFVASGCTAEANRADPDDYSTWFFAALSGRLPGDKPLPGRPDIDGDGTVSLEEAHAFARIHDGTLDVPVSTSEVYLRTARRAPGSGGLSLTSPFASILKAARPTERAVLEALAKELGLVSDPAAGVKARYEADRLSSERSRLLDQARGLEDRRDAARDRVKRGLLERWPWLGNPYHPLAAEVERRDREAVLKFIGEHPDRAEMDRLGQEARAMRKQVSDLEVRWARWERLARAAEIVVMGTQVRAGGNQADVAKLDAILRCESDPW